MSVEIPEKCLNCPALSIERSEIDQLNPIIDKLISTAMSPFPDVVAEIMQTERDERGYGGDPRFDPDQIAANLRAKNSNAVQQLEAKVAECEDRINALTDNCGGSLGMRAVRDGVQYTARICTSPFMTDIDPRVARPSFVEQKTISES